MNARHDSWISELTGAGYVPQGHLMGAPAAGRARFEKENHLFGFPADLFVSNSIFTSMIGQAIMVAKKMKTMVLMTNMVGLKEFERRF